MTSKEQSPSTVSSQTKMTKGKKIALCIGCTGLFALMAICAFAARNCWGKKKDSKANPTVSIQPTNPSEVDKVELTDEQKRILEVLVAEYEGAVAQFNLVAGQYNQLIALLSGYKIQNLPEEVHEREKHLNGVNKGDWNVVEEHVRKAIESVNRDTEDLKALYDTVYIEAYEVIEKEYNTVVEAYNSKVSNCAIKYISEFHDHYNTIDLAEARERLTIGTADDLKESIDGILYWTNTIAEQYMIIMQIQSPSEEWVAERLTLVGSVTGYEKVTETNNPDGLLNKKDGGYLSCTYFTIKEIDATSVKGNGIVDKGVDAGGSIEVYGSLENALARCEYLSMFDGTILYSGAYVAIGTMVIRVSYKLTNEQQITLIDEIVNAMTTIK